MINSTVTWKALPELYEGTNELPDHPGVSIEEGQYSGQEGIGQDYRRGHASITLHYLLQWSTPSRTQNIATKQLDTYKQSTMTNTEEIQTNL